MRNLSSKTKVNFRQSSRKTTYFKIVVGIGVAILFLYTLGNVLGAFSSYLIEPVYVIRSWLLHSTDTIPSYIRSRSELIKEMDALKGQISTESENIATIKRLNAENDELRALMSFVDEKRIASIILSRPPFMPYDGVLIDRGSQDGVAENAIVYGRENVAIGFVSRVFEKTAFVTLFSTSGIEGTAYIYGPNIYATFYGEGGGVIRLSVPQGIAIAVGDVVVLPVTEKGTIGMISYIESSPTEPEQDAFIIQETPIQSLRFLGVSSRIISPITYEEAERIVAENRNDNLHIEVPVEMVIDGDFATTTSTTTDTEADIFD